MRPGKKLLLALGALLLCGCLLFAAQAETAKDVTAQCGFRVSAGKKKLLTDGDIKTYWGPRGEGARVGIILPENVVAGTLVIEWYAEPGDYTVGEYDAERTLIRERTQDDTFVSIIGVWPLDPQTKNILLTLKSRDQAISSITVYSAGELPADVQTWDAPWDKADIMLVSAHQDDEFIYMGGTIPYYSVVRDARVTVVYMTDCGRHRRREALRGLWTAGLRNYPEFINLKDKRISSFDKSVSLWGGKTHVLEVLVERIRKYKPEVIVTHDLNGEYGHNQHKITARAMKYAIAAAADPEYFPGSAAQYGTWQVKKLYNHLYKKNQIKMDWTTKLPELGGKSPLQVAKLGYAEHVSQQRYFQVVNGGKYDNALFGLAYTAVGPDVVGGDMLENIPLDALNHAPPEPELLPSNTPDPLGTLASADEAEDPFASAADETDIAMEDAAIAAEPVEAAPVEEDPVEMAGDGETEEAPLLAEADDGETEEAPLLSEAGEPATDAGEADEPAVPLAMAAAPSEAETVTAPAVEEKQSNTGLWIALGATVLVGAGGVSFFHLASKPAKTVKAAKKKTRAAAGGKQVGKNGSGR